ncbi:MAG: hypothetical protein SGCHY_003387, partial [Lobulomycetales sp.]
MAEGHPLTTCGSEALHSRVRLADLQAIYLYLITPSPPNPYSPPCVVACFLAFLARNMSSHWKEHDSLEKHASATLTYNPSIKAFPSVAHLHPSQMKRILITGGAGFVGSHLVDRLMLMGHSVTVVDNLFTGNKRNISQWLGHPHFDFILHDVVDPFKIEVDQIYHLACPASPPHYQYNPVKTCKTAVLGTLNMLGLAKRIKARILISSTSEVYGDPEQHPQKETYWGNVNPIGPRACYDEGKRVAETLTYCYQKQDGVDVRVARIFNTFGPRMNEFDGRVVSNFIIQS